MTAALALTDGALVVFALGAAVGAFGCWWLTGHPVTPSDRGPATTDAWRRRPTRPGSVDAPAGWATPGTAVTRLPARRRPYDWARDGAP